MIYVARIDDAFAHSFNFNGQYFYRIPPDPLFLSSSLSVISFHQTASAKILYFQLGPSIILFIREPIEFRVADSFSSIIIIVVIIIIIIINSTIIDLRKDLPKTKKRKTYNFERESIARSNRAGLYTFRGRIYIYIVEEGHFSRGSAVIVARLDFEITAT